MTSSIANTSLDESPKKAIAASEVEIEANRRAARQMAAEVVEGLRKLAQQKASRKAPNQAAAGELKKALAQSSYGQGEVVASPFQMARVAATVANNGAMPQGRWLADENNGRVAPPADVFRSVRARRGGGVAVPDGPRGGHRRQ